MPEQNEQDTDPWATMMPDSRSPFFERDLRRMRRRLLRQGSLLAFHGLRVKLQDAFESLARWRRPKVDVNSVRLS